MNHFATIRFARVCLPAALALSLLALNAFGQTLTPEQRRQAGASYDQGIAARAGGDHASAASFFETANRIAPSTQALGNAIRSHHDAHTPAHNARAATLALMMLQRYGSEPRAVSYARNLIQELGPGLGHVRVQCTGCEVEVDRAAASGMEFYLEPGAHHVIGFWGQRTRDRDFTIAAGATQDITIAEPPPDARTAQSDRTTTTRTADGRVITTRTVSSGGMISVAVPVVFLILTLGAGGVLGWSTWDMYQGVPAYQATPTVALLQDGQARELRTDVMIGVTAGLGAITLITLILSRVGGHQVEAAPAVSAMSGYAPGLTLRGRF